jgi:uncharacterized membrane protein
MRANRRVEVLQLAILGGMFLAAAIAWPSTPDRIPVHWNTAGEVDGDGSRVQGLLLLPGIALVQYLILRFLPLMDPGRVNYANFQGAYDTIRVALIVLLAVVYGLVHAHLRGGTVDVGLVVPMLLCALFVVVGNTLGKLRPNWFVGIRTPWTLSSKEAWIRTHRLVGWLMVGLGLATIAIVPFIGARGRPLVVVVGALAVAAWSMAYSYWVWRDDPLKVPPAGTSPADLMEASARTRPDRS